MFLFLFVFLLTIQSSMHSMQQDESVYYKRGTIITVKKPITAFAVDQYTGNVITVHKNKKIKIRKQSGAVIQSINQPAQNINVDMQNIVICNPYPDNSIKIFDKETGKLKAQISPACFTKLAGMRLYRKTGAVIALDEESESLSSIKIFNSEGKGIREFTVPFGQSHSNSFEVDQRDGSIACHYNKESEPYRMPFSDQEYKEPNQHYMLHSDQEGHLSDPLPFQADIKADFSLTNKGDVVFNGYDELLVYKKSGILVERIHDVVPWNYVFDQNNNIIYATQASNTKYINEKGIKLKMVNENGTIDILPLKTNLMSTHMDIGIDNDQNVAAVIGTKEIHLFERKKNLTN